MVNNVDLKAFSSLREEQGHFFNVLSHGSQEALLPDFGNPSVNGHSDFDPLFNDPASAHSHLF
jgi:hypothetical protein